MFGESHIETIAAELGTEVLGKMPIDPRVAELCDRGEIENMDQEYLAAAADHLILAFIKASRGECAATTCSKQAFLIRSAWVIVNTLTDFGPMPREARA
ncbi:P-loop containing nucleoside triphosphate hydrolase [Acididesulfobacillus acetoxydans]|uniref:P-loop containing nucleoside triphosphate hydrolase n=1 Tax=Acididesulfobacillus acetoxydans TaxID=1561005 RepID=A0A8S0Y3P1_9FIRM|nr:Mrp/NBP35 family ATP-binding protein [Acididesulfobacillus acetoxydans]CAA7602265.1 P-loop containing nucleoside triphosphate hydrolase [Acididesulfobacillus acetoxydans]CEJ07517.1 Hypothetical protein DEACI_1983 [Acididesulfobacillus acetoxydans]